MFVSCAIPTASKQCFSSNRKTVNIVKSRLKSLGELGRTGGHTRGSRTPSSGDLQLSDSLRHDFLTVLVLWYYFYDLLDISRATSLSVENGVDSRREEKKNQKERRSRRAFSLYLPLTDFGGRGSTLRRCPTLQL